MWSGAAERFPRARAALTAGSAGVTLGRMKLARSLMAVVAFLVPSVALACPYASGSMGCGTCDSSLLGYGTWLLLGLGIGLGSVAFERRT
jgi:hypothetical protein